MRIKINLNPIHVSGKDFLGRWRSRGDVLSAVQSNHCVTYGTFGDYLSPLFGNEDHVRVYSLEKHRKKVNVLSKPRKWTKKRLRDNGYLPTDDKWDTREVIHPTHWTAVYYDIPIALLKAAKLRVVQGKRTWKFESIK